MALAVVAGACGRWKLRRVAAGPRVGAPIVVCMTSQIWRGARNRADRKCQETNMVMGAHPPRIKTTAALVAKRQRAWMIYLKKVPHEPCLPLPPSCFSSSSDNSSLLRLHLRSSCLLLSSVPSSIQCPRNAWIFFGRYSPFLILLKSPQEWSYLGD